MVACSKYLPTERGDEIRDIFQTTSTVIEEGTHMTLDIPCHSDSGSDTSDDDDPYTHDESLPDIIDTLMDEIDCLVDLGPRLEEPVPDLPSSDKLSPAIAMRSWDPAIYFAERVRMKFPDCDTNLADALGKANLRSMVRLQARREAANKNQGEAGVAANAPTSADKETLFQDSGLGTSLPATSSYAATIVSYGGDGHTRAKIPPLPVDVKNGQRFQCIACGEYVEKRDMRAWK